MPGLNSFPINADVLPKLAGVERPQRMLEMAQRWDYYDGQHKKFLKQREGEPDYNVIVNLCRRVVEQSVSFLAGERPQFDLPGESEEIEAQEAVLNAWLDAHDVEEWLPDLLTTSAVTGHAFVKLIPDAARDDVRMIALDPMLVSAFWKADDKSQTVGYMIWWEEVVDNQVVSYREDHLLDERGVWVIIHYRGSGDSWVEQGREDWPYPFAQIVDWKNLPNPRGYYGRSDLSGMLSLNDAYNFRQSNTNKILYIHAHPRTMAFGVQMGDIQKTAIDGFWAIPNPEARVENLEMQSDLESSRKQAEDMKADFFNDAQMVDVSSVKDKVGALTNFGLRLMFAEALAKNRRKRTLAGRGLAEMVRRAGVMLGVNWDGCKVGWQDPLPDNIIEEISVAKETIGMGISSRQTQSEKMGYDWERESQRMADEQAQRDARLGDMLLEGMQDKGEQDEA